MNVHIAIWWRSLLNSVFSVYALSQSYSPATDIHDCQGTPWRMIISLYTHVNTDCLNTFVTVMSDAVSWASGVYKILSQLSRKVSGDWREQKTVQTRKQKHHLEGNAVPAGYCHTNANCAGGVNNSR